MLPWLFLRYKQQLVQKASGWCVLPHPEIHYGSLSIPFTLFFSKYSFPSVPTLQSKVQKLFLSIWWRSFYRFTFQWCGYCGGLPKDLRGLKRIKFSTVSPRNSATLEYYITEVLPRLVNSKAIGIIVNGGNCLKVSSKPMLNLFCFLFYFECELKAFPFLQ